jgi:hypothetical protein
MDTLIHADVFFFITSVAVVLVSIATIIITVYLVGILSDVKHMSREWKKENEHFIRDARSFRDAVRDEGMKWKHIADAIHSFIEKFIAPKKSSKKTTKK